MNHTDGSTKFDSVSVPFTWSVKTLDMSLFSYFWIVMFGVIVSRLLTLALNKMKAKQRLKDLRLGARDAV